MKSLPGFRTSLALALSAAGFWSRISYGQEPSGPGPGGEGEPAPIPGAPNAPPAVIPSHGWYDAVKIEAFVDAYASVNANFPKPQSGQNLGRNFDVTNGFAVHWAGLNFTHAPDPIGGTVGLRFGPGALLFNAGSDAGAGLGFVKQAFASWRPVNGMPLQLDFGKFDTWIGAEAADSQYNMTYTRSALFTTQPMFHTGLRVDLPASDEIDLRLYAVNGYNASIDNNAMKTFGATLAITPAKAISLYLNYIAGPEQSDLAPGTMGSPATVVRGANERWRHLADLVADFKFGRGHVLVNADYGTEKLAAGTLDVNDPEKSVSWFGGNLTLGYPVTDLFAVALRGSYVGDRDGYMAPLWGAPAGQGASVVEGTLTLAVTPTPALVIKLEPRIDAVASEQSGWKGGFPEAPDAAPPGVSKTLFTTTLGVVATTN